MAEEKEKQTKEKENTDAIQLVEVTTQTAPAFKLPDETVVGTEDYLVWLGNLVYKIAKNTS